MTIKKNIIISSIIIAILCIVLLVVTISLNILKEKSKKISYTNIPKEEQQVNENDEYYNIKSEFDTLFTNDIESFQEKIEAKKIVDKLDIVATGYNFEKNEGNINLSAQIPCINIDETNAKDFNKKILEKYKQFAEKIEKQVSSMNIICSIGFKAYIQNNIISLAIKMQYKEGSKSQKTIIETFNYDIKNNTEVTLAQLLQLKNISKEKANEKIKNEIKKIQEQNAPLISAGYPFYVRDYMSSEYEIKNTKHFLYGKNGMLYVIYPYGEKEETSEMDIIIFK